MTEIPAEWRGLAAVLVLDSHTSGPYTPSLAFTEPTRRPISTRRETRNRYLLEILMPNHKSAEKRMRQNERRRKLNRGHRTRVRTSIKNLRVAVSAGDGTKVKELLPETISTIDKAVQKGVLHKNAAARYKSRLTTSSNTAITK
jgi:small subunit ribosomal protein S20